MSSLVPPLLVGAVTLIILYTLLRIVGKKRTESFDWSRQRVVVTGGANGIGLAVLNELLLRSKGAIAIVSLDIDHSSQGFASLGSANITALDVDVRDLCACDPPLSQAKNVAAAEEALDHATVVIQCAGICIRGRVQELNAEQVSRLIDVMLMSCIRISQRVATAVLKRKEDQQCHIVHVSSALGLLAVGGQAVYSAAKFGLVGFNEGLRQDLAGTEILTSAICPGHVDTRMFSHVRHKHTWLFKKLSAETVAVAIADIVESRESQEVWLPWTNFLSISRPILPIRVMDIIRVFLKASDYD